MLPSHSLIARILVRAAFGSSSLRRLERLDILIHHVAIVRIAAPFLFLRQLLFDFCCLHQIRSLGVLHLDAEKEVFALIAHLHPLRVLAQLLVLQFPLFVGNLAIHADVDFIFVNCSEMDRVDSVFFRIRFPMLMNHIGIRFIFSVDGIRLVFI